MRKKIFLIILAIVLFSNLRVQAIATYENTKGTSEKDVHYPCDNGTSEGCAYASQDFRIRVTLVDKDRKIVPGTQTVQFEPLNPYHDNDHYEEWEKDKSDAQSQGLSWERIRYNFNGSQIAKDADGRTAMNNLNTMADHWYEIYLGFGKDEEVENDFTDYADNRAKFMKFVTSLEKGIYVQDIGRNVDFISFFLKVCGYTDTLTKNKGAWTATEIYDIADKIGNKNQYYLLIEPVYSYFVNIRDKNGVLQQYYATGTASQLAYFYIYAHDKDLKEKFWAARTAEVAFNHACNFIDLSEQYANLVSDSNVEIDGKKVSSYEYVNYYGKYYCKDLATIKSYSDKTIESMIALQAQFGSGFGKNLIDLSSVMRDNKPPKATCKLEVDSCTIDDEGKNIIPNDNFKIITTLSAEKGKISDCIYPGKMATEEELNEYVYHVGEGENQLWCYDDITYDFSKIRTMLNGKTFSKNQLIEMPVGELNVTRTCYTKSSDVNNINLNKVFTNDPGEYQKNFKFEFNNKTYEFVKNSYKYQEPLKKEEECDSHDENCMYTYTEKIHYQYEINNSTPAKNANININDLQLYNTVSNTNSIDFIEKRKESKIVKITNNIEEGKITNRLSTQITNGFGITNKIYNKLKSPSVTKMSGINMDEDTKETITYYRTSDGVNHNQVSSSLDMDLEENKKEYCNVSSTISKDLSQNTQFRVISLSNPFPARDGTTRLPGENWINRSENNAYYYIQNNRNVNGEEIYNKKPLYKIKLDAKTMVKIREYNKKHSYSDYKITCENGTGRMCLSSFLRDTKYIEKLEGTCKTINPKEITELNRKILDFEKTGCNLSTQCMVMRQQAVKELDLNGDGYVKSDDLLKNTADFYTCADKSPKSGG